MDRLNFPQYEFKIRQKDGKNEILDIIRKKYVILLPEEWVRQHVIHYLIKELNYPKGLMRVESGMHYNRLAKRSDILVFDNTGGHHLLVECKSNSQPINQSVLDQVTMYNKELRARYILITNGINHYCCEFIGDQEYNFINAIPKYE